MNRPLPCPAENGVAVLDDSSAAMYIPAMRACFKEWAVVVDALGRGDQIIILRKGGISEGRGGFQMEHRQFWFFQTLFHQQRDSVLPAAQSRYDEIAPTFPPTDRLHLKYWAEVVDAKELKTLAAAEALRGQHIWRDEVIAGRFDWGTDKGIYALALRVKRLPVEVDLPMLPKYGGCKSWIELDEAVDTAGSIPVLSEDAFHIKLDSFHVALDLQPQDEEKADVPAPK